MSLDLYRIKEIKSIPRKFPNARIEQKDIDEEMKYLLIGVVVFSIISLLMFIP